MKWKTVAKVARLTAYAVVPGAAGYMAYKHVIRPWLDKRAAKKRENLPSQDSLERAEGRPTESRDQRDA